MAISALAAFARGALHHEIGRRSPLRALARFARLQVQTRLSGSTIAVPFVDGTRIHVGAGQTGANGNYYFGLHEVGQMAFVLHYLRPGDRFVDAGANVGSFTILASGAVGARSLAVEPVPATLAQLGRNIALNGLEERVSVRPVCLGRERGRVAFTTGHGTMNRVAADGDADTVEVPMSTLDAEARGAVDLVKIDAEGHDGDVLRGAAGVLGADRPMAVVVEAVDDEALGLLRRAGFRPVAYRPFERRIVPADDRSGFIFVRDLDHARDRVAAAPRFGLNGWGSV